jgi:hypothetical protein
MPTKTRQAITSRKELMRFSQDCLRAHKIGSAIPAMPSKWAGTSYGRAYAVLVRFWNDEPITQSAVFASDGNTKLPFWAFSAMAIITCPGMGDCGLYCYSLKAWRNAFAWLRQLINTLRLHSVSGRNQIVQAWQSIPQGETVRLYVDGDFDSAGTMRFWFSLMTMRPDLKVYGYSKSWALFLDWEKSGRPFPDNYILNLSSGSKYDDMYRQAVARLPIVRGEFIGVKSALPMPKGTTSAEIRASTDWIPYQSAVRQAAQAAGYDKVFVCPGKCGDCGIKAHACGNTQLTIPVAIAIH